MHSPKLGQTLGPHRSKTCRPDLPVWLLAPYVLVWVIEDLLGTCLEVRLAVLVPENV